VHFAAIVIEADDLVGQVLEVTRPEIVARGCASAARIDVRRSAPRYYVVEMYSAKVDAVAGNAPSRWVRSRGTGHLKKTMMPLGGGNSLTVRLSISCCDFGCSRASLRTCSAAFSRFLALHYSSDLGVIGHRLGEVAWIETYRILSVQGIDRHPRIAVWMKGVGKFRM
jgi:hypothetical protein